METMNLFLIFILKVKVIKLAVELELNLKSQSRYFLKIAEYKNSRFTHVLYVATHIRSLQRLLRTFSYRRYIGISHYSEVETVSSHRYGKQSLLNWLKERTKMISKEKDKSLEDFMEEVIMGIWAVIQFSIWPVKASSKIGGVFENIIRSLIFLWIALRSLFSLLLCP